MPFFGCPDPINLNTMVKFDATIPKIKVDAIFKMEPNLKIAFYSKAT